VLRQALAPALYEVVHSPHQNAVFVASAGGFEPGAPASRLLRLNPQTLAIEAEVALPLRGFGLALDDAANRLYVGHGLDASITVLDTRSLSTVGRVALAEKIAGEDGKAKFEHHFRQLVLDPARHRLYAPGLSTGDSALYVVDTRALRVEKVVRGLGQVATGVGLDAAGQRLFVSNMRGGLFEVDTRTLTLTHRRAVKADQLLNLAYDAHGRRLFATDQGLASLDERRRKADPQFVPTPGNRVVVFDPDTGAITASLPTGAGPIALLHDAPRQRLFVTNRGAGTVTVFDTRTLQLRQTIALPPHPNSLALDPAGNVLYVTVKNGRESERGAAESVARIAF
jgi:YVTN family beta-propeller protein